MNKRSDINRVLETWMDDGPSTMPDRVIDVVADRISKRRQRPAWRLIWRRPMNTQLKVFLAAAAVLVVAVVGWNLLPKQPGVGGTPTASPSPTTGPTGTPVATGPVDLRGGLLTAGAYRIQPVPDLPSLTIVADIPAEWQGHPEVPALVSPGDTSNTGVVIGFMVSDGLFSDPCHWDLDGTASIDQPGDVVVGPIVDDLVAALKANTSYPSSAATPVTLGGFEGQELELQLPGDDVLTTCDRRSGELTGDYVVFPVGFWAQGPNSRWHLYIVDVAGTRLITMISSFEGTPQADVAAARAIVESFEITP